MKYRKKPVVIDAMQWTGDNYAEIFEFTEGRAYPAESHSDTLIVSTLEGEGRQRRGATSSEESLMITIPAKRLYSTKHTNK